MGRNLTTLTHLRELAEETKGYVDAKISELANAILATIAELEGLKADKDVVNEISNTAKGVQGQLDSLSSASLRHTAELYDLTHDDLNLNSED